MKTESKYGAIKRRGDTVSSYTAEYPSEEGAKRFNAFYSGVADGFSDMCEKFGEELASVYDSQSAYERRKSGKYRMRLRYSVKSYKNGLLSVRLTADITRGAERLLLLDKTHFWDMKNDRLRKKCKPEADKSRADAEN